MYLGPGCPAVLGRFLCLSLSLSLPDEGLRRAELPSRRMFLLVALTLTLLLFLDPPALISVLPRHTSAIQQRYTGFIRTYNMMKRTGQSNSEYYFRLAEGTIRLSSSCCSIST